MMHLLPILFSVLVYLVQDLPEKNSIVSSGSSMEAPFMACDRRSDSLELVKFYNATGGLNWTNKWDFSKPIDSWWGVKLNTNGCVQELSLIQNNLTDTLIDLNLTELRLLDLPENNLIGNLPSFKFLKQAELINLFKNQFTGSIPNLDINSKLVALKLSANKFSGDIPVFTTHKNLVELWLNENDLIGFVPDHLKYNPSLNLCYYYSNRLTFSGLIKNLTANKKLVEVTNNHPNNFSYSPQQKFYSDTTITISPNVNYTLDLLIDDTVTTSTYTWYKDDVLYKTIKGINKLSFTPFTINDAGTYTVKITNPLAPQLTLESRSIHLNPSSSEQDCSNARILNISPCLPAITIDSISGSGSQNDEADNSCLDFNNSDPRNNKSESNSQWFKWTASDSSKLTFIIKSKLAGADIDFSLFELIDGIDGCETKKMIRCNATACLGPTGLKESSTDIEESPNCDPGEDGFLKALQQIPERSYALLINNFTNNSGYTIEFNPQIIVLNPDQFKGKFQTDLVFKALANDSISNNLPIKVNIENPANGYIEYNQSNGEGKFKPDQGYSGKEIVQYTVCPIDCPSNCQNSTIEFEVASKCSDRNSIVLPNILFPNGPSGTNRYFIVEAIKNCPDAFGPKPHKLQVFNRWSNEVYRNDNYLNDWDGTTTSGHPLPEGTYYYLLDLGSVSAPARGYVVIVR